MAKVNATDALALNPQTRKVLRHLERNGSLSLFGGFSLGVTRLAARIHELRKAGFNIHTQMVPSGDTHYAVYHLVPRV
ncbi:hypothetical protein GGR34_000772 [Microvirga flocculans]|uniref:Winged helix-turn-helix domain-containing protein n=1 Tax=Microvirga flocculans TaxID=217168 RepID=A0A7W6N6Z9_9HYPH|nr:helix-turn-helix domain-containing protein [Microvirga flocculans]MBB4039137.1 hypothetical protein [Microvirga flocculans]